MEQVLLDALNKIELEVLYTMFKITVAVGLITVSNSTLPGTILPIIINSLLDEPDSTSDNPISNVDATELD